ncbi:hypothetical protein ACHAXT_001882 [Thalassiosira profunda]
MRESLATTALTASTLSSDRSFLPQAHDGVDNDQVGPLKEVSRGYMPRRTSVVSPRIREEAGEDHSHPDAVDLPLPPLPSRRKLGAIPPPCGSLSGRRGSSLDSHPQAPAALPPRGRRRSSSLSEGSLNRRLSRLSRDDDPHTVHFVEEESYISETERKFKGEEGFEDVVSSVAEDFHDTHTLLRRTRAVSALANRLMDAPDEATCFEEVTRLLVLMFGLKRVSFGLLTGQDHFLYKRVSVKRRESFDTKTSPSSMDLEVLDSDTKRPLEGTAAGECVRTLRQHYTPRTCESPFETHKVLYRQGLNSALVTPILVNGGRATGVILLPKGPEDAFKKSDRVLISDIGLLLGANIYAKRLLKATEESKHRQREMLQSFIPQKILEKIECYWEANADEPKSHTSVSSGEDRSDLSISMSSTHSNASRGPRERSNAWYVAQSNWAELEAEKNEHSKDGIKEMIKEVLESDSDEHVILMDDEMDFAPTTHALYAESVKDVCIVFADIVGFSRISMNMTPTKVMDMLQNLFGRFDELCDVHGVLKLETIGDAYICCTNLLEDDACEDDGANAALRALAMAKDMILETSHVQVPSQTGNDRFETLQIRVGIHVGDVTCGVLGQRLPKFTTCGAAVNMAARMEQTSLPNRIRVTKAFHDMIGDAESGWSEMEVIELKNMGQQSTFLLDPLDVR